MFRGHGRTVERTLLLALIVACLPLVLDCGGSSGGGVLQPTKVPIFHGSGTSSAPDLVTLSSGGTSPGSLIQVDVKLGGPTTSTDLSAFSFDVVLSNPSIVRSVNATKGDALTGDQSVLASISGDKVVVGASKLGGTGNGVGAQGATILSLVFKMDPTAPGTTNLTFSGATVQDHTGTVITTINFDSAAAQLEQPQ